MNAPRLAAVAAVLVGTALRLHQLTLRPFHHDEGVNGFFLMRLVNEGYYRYDPSNYHGPTLYYLTLPLVKLLGLSSFAVRLLPVLFGVALLVLVACQGRRLGAWAAAAATAFLAVSPGAVFFSRYYIHEMMVLLFTLALVVEVDGYLDRKTPLRLFGISATLAMLFATKETAAPTVVVLIVAGFLTTVWGRLGQGGRASAGGKGARRGRKAAASAGSDGAVDDDAPHRNAAVLMWALVLFVCINALFYTSFYANRAGLVDAVKAYAFWSKTGESSHVHPFGQYIAWMWLQEAPILVLGCVGIVTALVRRPNRFVVFCAFWALGVFAMYSLIKYKTPWLTVNIVLPLALMSGYAIQQAGQALGRAAAIAVFAGSFSLCLWQAVQLNFVHYDDNDERQVYVYAHTVRDVYRLLDGVHRVTDRLQGPQTPILIVTPTYWPLPWYLKDYRGAQFFGKMVGLTEASVVVADAGQEAEVRAATGGALQPEGTYELRPGVYLQVWGRTESGRR